MFILNAQKKLNDAKLCYVRKICTEKSQYSHQKKKTKSILSKTGLALKTPVIRVILKST